MQLTTKAKQTLKARAHSLKPIVFIGNNGVTENVIKELDRALYDHELIKVSIQTADRTEREAVLTAICESTTAVPIQLIGKIGIIYRVSDK